MSARLRRARRSTLARSITAWFVSSSGGWGASCSACGEWNTVEVNFREEIPLEELGLSPAPIYTSGI